MDSDVAHPGLGKWSWALLWLTVGVIVGGSLVRATGSGDGCGESWPRCEGSLFPLGGGTETSIEFAHRLATVLLGVALVALLIAARRSGGVGRQVQRGLKWTGVFFIGEVVIGAVLVLAGWVDTDASIGRTIVVPLHLVNTFFGLMIFYTATALPFCLWQMKGYYDTIPPALEEAARIDGCNRWDAFWRIILPLAVPGLVITALFSFMAAWSEYIVAAQVLQDRDMFTLPLGLRSFQATMSTQWGLYAAAAIVVSIPVVTVFVLLSRYLVSGLTLGSVK